jgi:hypothetical protein
MDEGGSTKSEERVSSLASQLLLLASRFSLLASRFSPLASRLLLLVSRLLLLASRLSLFKIDRPTRHPLQRANAVCETNPDGITSLRRAAWA